MAEAASKTIRLKIDRLTYGPDAIARDEDGRAIFVQGAIPGDTVEAEIYEEGQRFAKAKTVRILEASPDRVKAPCPFVGICGGCPWGNIRYEAQLEAKRAHVVDALVRIGHIPQDRAEELVLPCAAPGDPWGYRNKVELAFARQGKRTIVGMHALDGSVIKVPTCPLLQKGSEKLVKAVSGSVTYLANFHGLTFDRIGIRTSARTHATEVALWTSPSAFPRAAAAKVITEGAKVTSLVRVMSKGPQKARKIAGVECLAGDGFWSERLVHNTMRISAPSFFQVNTKGAETLVHTVLDWLEPDEDDEAMDLYCGAGTFTLPLAERTSFVSAVESYGPAVRDLSRNLKDARLENVDAIGGDAGREFPDTDADIIVVDPPRAGLAADVVHQLSEQPARAIAYVSCDPATLARDIARFEEEGTFEAKKMQPVDLFPQSFHVETVTLLKRVRPAQR